MRTFTEWLTQKPKIYGIVTELLPLANLAAMGEPTDDRQFHSMVSDALRHVDELHYDEKAGRYAHDLRAALEVVAGGNKKAVEKLHNLLRSVNYAMTGELD